MARRAHRALAASAPRRSRFAAPGAHLRALWRRDARRSSGSRRCEQGRRWLGWPIKPSRRWRRTATASRLLALTARRCGATGRAGAADPGAANETRLTRRAHRAFTALAPRCSRFAARPALRRPALARLIDEYCGAPWHNAQVASCAAATCARSGAGTVGVLPFCTAAPSAFTGTVAGFARRRQPP